MATSTTKERVLHLVIDERDDTLLNYILHLLERRPETVATGDEALLDRLLEERSATPGAGIPWRESLAGIMRGYQYDEDTIERILNRPQRPPSSTLPSA